MSLITWKSARGFGGVAMLLAGLMLLLLAMMMSTQLRAQAKSGTSKKAGTTAAGASKATTSMSKTTSAKSTTPSGGPTAHIMTTAGELTCTLYEKQAPKTVANFIGLAEGTKEWRHPFTHAPKKGTPLYNGTIFHRVIPGFMIQGGDPVGTGSGDPGYAFEDEVSPELKFDRPGRMAMANSGPNTNGSQFFITEAPYPSLNMHYSLFGQCDDASVQLVRKIARMARDERNDKPFQPVKITQIKIDRAGAAKSTVGGGESAMKKKPASTGKAAGGKTAAGKTAAKKTE